ncbi:MAG: ABC transporter ATP-binding protein [Spirochaetaceae bacterium]|nr:ABC transporter ATP-binding protein [Spirochaetaceae bacterium]
MCEMATELTIQGLRKEYPIFSTLSQRLRTALSFGLWLPAKRHVALCGLDLVLGGSVVDPDEGSKNGDAEAATNASISPAVPMKDRHPETGESSPDAAELYPAADSGLTKEASPRMPGRIIGVVGPNGAGKSTLLRILSGVSRPSAGRIQFQGSIRSILELGVGFSAELTARQNIEHNGVLWNYSYNQLKKKTDEILEFAEIQDYADQPLKTFSTGMQMRLAFSVATLERSDLLLVDEALAVGDASFQQKCLNRFRQYRESGSLILIVSHDMNLLRSVCDEMVLLHHGQLEMQGSPTEIARRYMDLIARSPASSGSGHQISEVNGLKSSLQILNERSVPVNRFYSGDKAFISISLEASRDMPDLTCGIHIESSTGVLAFGTNSYLLKQELHGSLQRQEIRFSLKLNLGPGKYTIGYSLHRGKSHATDSFFWSHVSESFEIEAPTDRMFEGYSNLEPEIEIRTVQN